MIDPGHGGRDTGCSGAKVMEKEITLAVAQTIGKMINDSLPDVEVVYTRTDNDEFLRPGARADIANCSNADLLISVHCNSLPKYPSVRGTETYVMRYANKRYLKVDESKSDAAELVETHYTQNSDAVDMNNNFLTELDRYPNLYQSVILAGLVEKHFKTHTPLKSRGVRQENYSVLRDTYMPSVLIEMGFLSNREDEAFLSSTEGKNQIATAIYHAFSDYKKSMENKRIIK